MTKSGTESPLINSKTKIALVYFTFLCLPKRIRLLNSYAYFELKIPNLPENDMSLRLSKYMMMTECLPGVFRKSGITASAMCKINNY